MRKWKNGKTIDRSETNIVFSRSYENFGSDMGERKLIQPGKWSADFDENGNCIAVVYEESFRKILGYDSEAEFANANDAWLSIIHPDDVDRLDEYFTEFCSSKAVGREYDIEYRMMTKWGYRSFHDYAQAVRREDGSLLHVNGVVFDIQNILENEEAHKRLEENYTRFFALEDDFESLYDVNLENDYYVSYDRDEFYKRNVSDQIVSSTKYFADLRTNVENIVYEEDREAVYNVQKKEAMIAGLAEKDHIDQYYRIITENGLMWLKMRIVYKDEDKKNVIVGIFNAEEEMALRQKEEQLKEELLQTNSRLFALEDNFESLYDVELESGHYDVFVKGEFYKKNIINKMAAPKDYFEELRSNIDAVIYEEDRDNLYNLLTRAAIKDELARKEHFDYYYRINTDNGPVWFKMRVVYKDAEKKNIIIGVFNASSDVEAKQIAEQKGLLELQQKKLEIALDKANLETWRNDILAGIINGSKFTYDISADDKVIAAHYSQSAIETIGEACVENPMGWVEILHPDDREAVKKAFMASVCDHSGGTLYNVTFRIKGANGKYRWIRSGGNVIRHPNGTGEFFGICLDITEQMEEQQKRLLGAVPLSSDILTKANIGMWAFELDEGKAPRMYVDEAMLGLIGLDHQLSPEETYHAWYDYIDEDSYDLVHSAVDKMKSGEHAEVQYPWHNPDGRVIVVRCGGVRNYEYKKGIRIEGTHQDVTQTLHFDEEERRRAKETENELVMSKLRADSLAFIQDNEPDLLKAIQFFGNRILELSGCDQVVYRELGGERIVLNAHGVKDVPVEICENCPFSSFDCAAFDENGIVKMDDCRLGCRGVMTHPDCPAKSSYMHMIYSGGKLVGKLTVHYLKNYHVFSERAVVFMKTVAIYLGLLIGRITEKQAEIARIAAESSNKAKTEFLFNMSHDIRTPMNAILGYTDIALNHINEPEKVNDSLKKIKRSGGHLLSLINDILEMSRIEAGKLEIVNAPMNIYAVTEGVTAMSQALAATKDITFTTKIGDLKNPFVLADELHINQIVINLISNAVKYTAPGGTVEYTIDQLSEPVDGTARFKITVKDNGIGMSEEFLHHLFESFTREQTSTVSKQEGAGLGLAIVKNFVDIIGGTISVKSKKGEGSTFTMELPVQVMDDEEIARFKEENVLTEEPKDEFVFEGKKVLIVEDNEMNREIAAEVLREYGLVIDEAEDGSIAVKRIAEKGCDWYDFVLMDIQMPIMNGYEATAEIRKMPGGDKLPIIALSANAFEEDKQKSLDAGMNAHVAKPIEVKELFSALAKCC